MTVVFYRVRTLFTTLAVAEAENFILREGELWTEKDPATGNSTGRRKMGRGGVAWADLPFEPGGTGGGRVFNGFDEVVDPAPGDFVIDEDGTLYLRFDDGNSDQWVEASRPGADGEDGQDATLGTATPQPLGTAAAGTATAASREDHVHAMPSAADVEAEPAGTAAAAVAAHVAATDPHPNYLTQAEGDSRYRQSATALTDGDIPAGIARDAEVTAAVAAHEAAADPHPAYATAAEVSSAIAGKANTADLAAVATSGAYGDLSGLPTLGTAAAADTDDFALAAEGVTGGNSHDHSGGDGAQIAYSSLSGLPTIPPGASFYQEFTSTGTWTKPADCVGVYVWATGQGGPGGSGRRGPTTAIRNGGAGGGSGQTVEGFFPAAILPSEVTVTIGAPGTPGAAITVNNTNGQPGTAGGVTSFGTFLFAAPGNPGAAGTNATPALGGTSRTWAGFVNTGVSGGNGNASGAPSASIGGDICPSGGSGAAGQAANSTADRAGVAGGGGFSRQKGAPTAANQNSTLGGGTAGVPGPRPGSNGGDATGPGSGGGGGAYRSGQPGGNGGNGAFPGGGGGGGGASDDGFESGAGGLGGGAVVRVWCW